MKILRYELMPEDEFLAKLRQVRLRGFGNYKVYQDAQLQFRHIVDTDVLTPPQRYVLKPGVNKILEIEKVFREEFGIDVFNLRGALMFWPEGSDPEKDAPIPFLPPVVELSQEATGPIDLINDGMHRVWAARKLGSPVNIVHVSGVPTEYPYYAYPWPGGFGAVEEIDELSGEYQKKEYRNPQNYKALFRMFNEIFPGVQEARNQTNPVHIKE